MPKKPNNESTLLRIWDEENPEFPLLSMVAITPFIMKIGTLELEFLSAEHTWQILKFFDRNGQPNPIAEDLILSLLDEPDPLKVKRVVRENRHLWISDYQKDEEGNFPSLLPLKRLSLIVEFKLASLIDNSSLTIEDLKLLLNFYIHENPGDQENVDPGVYGTNQNFELDNEHRNYIGRTLMFTINTILRKYD